MDIISNTDAKLPYCVDEGVVPEINWKYILGCYYGSIDDTKVEDASTFTIPNDCVVENNDDDLTSSSSPTTTNTNTTTTIELPKMSSSSSSSSQSMPSLMEKHQRSSSVLRNGILAKGNVSFDTLDDAFAKSDSANLMNYKETEMKQHRRLAPQDINFVIIQPDDMVRKKKLLLFPYYLLLMKHTNTNDLLMIPPFYFPFPSSCPYEDFL